MMEISAVASAAAAIASKVDSLVDAGVKLDELVKKKGDISLNPQFFDLREQISSIKERNEKLRQEIENIQSMAVDGENLSTFVVGF